jgi:competence protein ComEC
MPPSARSPARPVVALALAIALALPLIAGCPPRRPATVEPAPPTAPPPRIGWRRVATRADLPAGPPAPGSWRIHLLDVGAGLSILVEGPDFTLLYDAGSSDPDERPLRVVAYLAPALGPSGDGACSEDGVAAPARRPIDHVVLSHPHQDHASALELVLHCFAVRHLWDSGRVVDTVFFRELMFALAASPGTAYHTAAAPPADRTRRANGTAIVIPPAIGWTSFAEGDRVALGARASFEVLHAEAKAHRDVNRNSIVLAVALGGARLLLTGDAGSGARRLPSAPAGDVEAHLLDHAADALDVDVLQVGHHGSLTSSRAVFLAAVSPALALVSAGPRRSGRVPLPDDAVLAALGAAGATVLRTDRHDAGCPVSGRIGGDRGPGGCDGHLITIESPPRQ